MVWQFKTGPFYKHELFLIAAWRSNYMHDEKGHEIIQLFPDFNGSTIE